jgi:hypothetical protein
LVDLLFTAALRGQAPWAGEAAAAALVDGG